MALLMARALSGDECRELMGQVRGGAWEPPTVLGGSAEERTSMIQWVRDARWLTRLRDIGRQAALVLDVDVDPDAMVSLQVSRYSAGGQYSWHTDHDASRTVVPDRKVSVVVALEDDGRLELQHLGAMRINAGDALAFPSTTRHRRPPAPATHHSLAAWIPGPRWR